VASPPRGVANPLARDLGLFQLTAFGVRATIGTGIFIVLSRAVPVGGPVTILSFVFAGVAVGPTAICYAELDSTVPVSGSRTPTPTRRRVRASPS
jgi:APA family basic amino acid/polyamine antiporter